MDYLSYLNQERDSIVNIENIVSIEIYNVSEINGKGHNGIYGLHDIVVYFDEDGYLKEKTIGRYSSHYNALYVLNDVINNIDNNASCVYTMPNERNGNLCYSTYYSSKYGGIKEKEEKVSQEENLEKE